MKSQAKIVKFASKVGGAVMLAALSAMALQNQPGPDVWPGAPAGFAAQLQMPPLSPDKIRPCHGVLVTSSQHLLPSRLLERALMKTPEFQQGALALAYVPGDADVVLQIGGSDLGGVNSEVRALNEQTQVSAWQSTSLTEMPGLVALAGIEQIARVCPANRGLRPVAGEEVTELSLDERKRILRQATSVAVVSQTERMKAAQLRLALLATPELQLAGVTVPERTDQAAITVQVRHGKSTLVWSYVLLDAASGAELDRGLVRAFNAESAAPGLAGAIGRNLAALRPDIKIISQPQHGADVLALVEKLGRCRTHLASSNFATPTDDDIDLYFDRDQITGQSTSGKVVFSVRNDQIVDVMAEQHSHAPLSDRVRDLARLDDLSDIEEMMANLEDPTSIAMGWTFFGGLIAGDDLLALALEPVRVRQHFVSIVWMEDGSERTVTLQVRGRQAKPLLTVVRAIRDAGPPVLATKE
jgi:hypothetical protein